MVTVMPNNLPKKVCVCVNFDAYDMYIYNAILTFKKKDHTYIITKHYNDYKICFFTIKVSKIWKVMQARGFDDRNK